MTSQSQCERRREVKPHRSSNDTTTNDGPQAPEAFVITKEYRRFAEFCDACRRYGYIGLCYGTPGVGKTLSARHYANWNQVEAYAPYQCASDTELAAVLGSNTIFYTPKVVNSPRQIEQAIQGWRHRLRAIPVEALYREEETLLARARLEDAAKKE